MNVYTKHISSATRSITFLRFKLIGLGGIKVWPSKAKFRLNKQKLIIYGTAAAVAERRQKAKNKPIKRHIIKCHLKFMEEAMPQEEDARVDKLDKRIASFDSYMGGPCGLCLCGVMLFVCSARKNLSFFGCISRGSFRVTALHKIPARLFCQRASN